MKFKIGQKVRCVQQPTNYDESDRMIFLNRIYTVKAYIKGHYVVLVEPNRQHTFREDRFEPIDILPEDLFTL